MEKKRPYKKCNKENVQLSALKTGLRPASFQYILKSCDMRQRGQQPEFVDLMRLKGRKGEGKRETS